jgi:hypothetical protein
VVRSFENADFREFCSARVLAIKDKECFNNALDYTGIAE